MASLDGLLRFALRAVAMGFRQFLLRDVQKVTTEWTLVCLAYNLRRLHILNRQPKQPAMGGKRLSDDRPALKAPQPTSFSSRIEKKVHHMIRRHPLAQIRRLQLRSITIEFDQAHDIPRVKQLIRHFCSALRKCPRHFN